MSWQTPIYDRTASDVSYARQHPEAAADLKGAWNASDYLRAKGNLEHLAAVLTAYGYPVTLQAMPEVTGASLGWQSYVQALTDNAAAVRGTITVMSTTPAVPAPSDPWGYSKVNDLERILLDVEQLITNMAAAWYCSGDLYGGEI